ncbi:MAG: hypothetical protein AAGE59_22550 [Cyanobacteria bacterium P01_F01_bin.86]
MKFILPQHLPPLRLLLVGDNLIAWEGKRAARQQRARARQQGYRLGGSGSVTQALVA